MLEPLTVAVMGLELALIIQSKPVRIASDNFGSNSASAFQADAYQQKPHLLLVGRAKPIQSPPLRFRQAPLTRGLVFAISVRQPHENDKKTPPNAGVNFVTLVHAIAQRFRRPAAKPPNASIAMDAGAGVMVTLSITPATRPSLICPLTDRRSISKSTPPSAKRVAP